MIRNNVPKDSKSPSENPKAQGSHLVFGSRGGLCQFLARGFV